MIASAISALPAKIAATISASIARDASSFGAGECSIITGTAYATELEEGCQNKAFAALTMWHMLAPPTAMARKPKD